MPQFRITHYVIAVFIFGVFDKGKEKVYINITHKGVWEYASLLFLHSNRSRLLVCGNNSSKEWRDQKHNNISNTPASVDHKRICACI